MEGSAPDESVIEEQGAWTLLEALARRACAGRPLARAVGLELNAQGGLEELLPRQGLMTVQPDAEPLFETHARLGSGVKNLLELYAPLCVGSSSEALVIGHVGQSLDGQIATASGASRYVTGPENIKHMHRLRALFDAVIVGANTVDCDDPLLTTRLVPGRNPTRVVIDPMLRLSGTQQMFRDRSAPTLVLCAKGREAGSRGHAEVVGVEAQGSLLDPRAIVATLARRGLKRLFVEGGGVTVSRFLAARTLDRLHVTLCPVFIGSGRPGILLPGIDGLEGALRPRSRRFEMGEDVLFDCAFNGLGFAPAG